MDRDRLDLKPLTISLAIATFPHIPRLPWWIIIWCFFFWCYSFSVHAGDFTKPVLRKWILVILTIAGIAGILLEYRTVLGQSAGIGLISIMASLKLLEVKSRRDLIITAFIIYFVIITNLLFSTSVLMTLYMFFSVFVNTAVLVLCSQAYLKKQTCMKISASLLIRALPLMIIMFVFFPRIQGTLWKGLRVNSGKAGFSDTLSPGSVSDLAVTGELAFRAEFNGKKPDVTELYWKGIVFGYFDGRSWKRSLSYSLPQYRSNTETELDYTVTLEPNNSRYMFITGCPVSLPAGTEILSDGTLRSKSIITDRLQYRILSEKFCDGLKWIEPSPEFTSLPRYGNNLSLNQAKRWTNAHLSEEEILAAALDFFKTGGYIYSLAPPPLLTEDTIDEFLFSTKKGYCEHYASAFAFLMRAAGIPSRVVGGYLGGDVNPVGGHMTITQDKAHAWVEVFLEKKGWTIVDPTSVVVPDRFTRGLSSAVPAEEMPIMMTLPENRFIGKIWKKTAYLFDYVNHGWNQFIIGYTYSKQKNFFELIGINPGKVTGSLFLVSIMLFSSMAVFLVVWRVKLTDPLRKNDPVKWGWLRFCQKLEKKGISRDLNEGPLEFLSRMGSLRPDKKKDAELIVKQYIRLRYSDKVNDPEIVSAFLIMVGKFRPFTNKPEIK